MQFSLTDKPIDFAALRQSLQRPDAGGFCCFEGWVRNLHEGKAVVELVYETYGVLAEKEGTAILAEASREFEILDAAAAHRIGRVEPGELAVWIGVTAAHRAAAFDACRFLIEAIKARVPIWKHEFYADGSDVWVDPTASKRGPSRLS